MKATTTTTTFSSSVAAAAVRHHHHHPPPHHRRRRQRSSTLTIKAHDGDDDEPIPVLRIPKVKTPQDVGVNPKYKQLIKEQTTQEEERKKDTVGARLQMVRSAMLDAEAKATQDASKFQSDAWSGDWRPVRRIAHQLTDGAPRHWSHHTASFRHLCCTHVWQSVG